MSADTGDPALGAGGRHRLEPVAAEGPRGGPVRAYRGAEIRCSRGGHVRGLLMEAHPFDGAAFGVPGTITPLVDLRLDGERLPGHERSVPEC